MSRTKKTATVIALIATGALLLTVGLALLLGLVMVGTVGAIAVIGYRRLRGRPLFDPVTKLDAIDPVRVVERESDEPAPGTAGFKVRYENEGMRRMLEGSPPPHAADDDADR